jgi:BlaI family penicillinase repressor
MKRLTDTEWIILHALWEGSPKALKDIIKKVTLQHPDIEWHYKTYHTYLSNMVEKGLLGFDLNPARSEKNYYPVITREEAMQMESKSLVSRIHYGRVGELVAMMADSKQLTSKDVKDLMELASRLEDSERG